MNTARASKTTQAPVPKLVSRRRPVRNDMALRSEIWNLIGEAMACEDYRELDWLLSRLVAVGHEAKGR